MKRGEIKGVFAAFFTSVLLTAFSGTSVNAAGAGETLQSDTKPGGIGKDIAGDIADFVGKHEDKLAGMAVSVFEKNDVLYEGYFGYTDKEAGTAVDEASVFEWGSATKTLVWVSAMQQAERGRLDLSADVRRYLPEGFLANEGTSWDTAVTMLDLMNHTAGYQELLVDLFVREGEDILPLGEQLRLHEPVQVYEPGTVTAYSNWGAALAAYIVECVSGQDFCGYVHENIFTPLGMEHSALAADLGDNPWVSEKRRELQCYTSDGALIPDCFYYISLYPAGMCTSTLHDMRLWAQALAARDERILSADSWAEFYKPTSVYAGTDIPRNCHGLWVELRASLAVGHGGNTAGCSSCILVEPESGLGVAVMTNQQNETVFNGLMMDLVFGAPDRKGYFGGTQAPSGVYRTARTVLAGPLKIYSAGFTGDFEDETRQPWHYAPGQPGGTLVQFAYTDYIRVPWAVMAAEAALLFGALAAVALAAVILTAKLICAIIRKRKGHAQAPGSGQAKAHGVWQSVSCAAVLLSAVLFGYLAVQVSSFAAYDSYRWGFICLAVLTVFMAALFLYGLFRIIKAFAGSGNRAAKNKTAEENAGKYGKRRRILNALVMVILFIILAFMGYFQVWRIWII